MYALIRRFFDYSWHACLYNIIICSAPIPQCTYARVLGLADTFPVGSIFQVFTKLMTKLTERERC